MPSWELVMTPSKPGRTREGRKVTKPKRTGTMGEGLPNRSCVSVDGNRRCEHKSSNFSSPGSNVLLGSLTQMSKAVMLQNVSQSPGAQQKETISRIEDIQFLSFSWQFSSGQPKRMTQVPFCPVSDN